MRRCNRCGEEFVQLHSCAHPLHAAVDPQCVYHTGLDGPLRCDVCGPVRLILDSSL